jgi:uncharacterized protein (DUF362 family)
MLRELRMAKQVPSFVACASRFAVLMRWCILHAALLGLAFACSRARSVSPVVDASAPTVSSPSAAATAPSGATVDTVTAASPAWNAEPSAALVVGDSVDGNALRTRTRARLLADVSPVIVLRGGTARELGARLCERVVPRRAKETRVLLKPNMGGFDWFKDAARSGGDDGVRGRITDPEFVRGVIQCLKARGHRQITVAEGWGATHADWERLIRVSGYEAMTHEEGAALVAMDDDGVFDVEGAKPGKPLGITSMEKTHVPRLLMPKILAEHLASGLFISLPKMKAHRYAVFSMGIKAAQGTVMLSDAAPAFRQKWRMHRELDLKKAKDPEWRAEYVASLEAFAERMADVLEVEAPDAVLADGAPIMHGDGFQKLVPSTDTIAVGGTNLIAVDRVGAELMGFWENAELGKELGGYKTSPLLAIVAKRFGVTLERPKVVGDGAGRLNLRAPYTLFGIPGFVLRGEMAAPDATDPPGSSGARTGTGADMPTQKSADRPTLYAAWAEPPPTVDGVIDAIWAHAKRTSFSTHSSGIGGGPATHVRALWNKGALSLLWELEGAQFYTDHARLIRDERAGLYQEDCVELMLAPTAANRDRYYEIELGPFGHYFDLSIEHSAGAIRSDSKWSSGLTIATTRDEAKHTAIIEATLTASEVLEALKANAQLPLGLFRMEGKNPRAYLAWSPAKTPKPNFHVSSAFGTLVLEAAAH